MSDNEPVAAPLPHRTPWLLLAAIALLAGGAAVAVWFGSLRPSGTQLDGKLTVLVRPADRNIEPFPVEQQGAAPVKSGGAMCLDAKLDEPAFLYFVWLDSAGHVWPLYPWNNERLEVKDVNEPPPERRATKLIFSPLLGGNWTFGDSPGTEVVLLLARRTPLPRDVQLGALLMPHSPTSLPKDNPVVMLSLDGSAKSVTVTHPSSSAKSSPAATTDDPLAQLMLRLQPHFELIRAVRFAHE